MADTFPDEGWGCEQNGFGREGVKGMSGLQPQTPARVSHCLSPARSHRVMGSLEMFMAPASRGTEQGREEQRMHVGVNGENNQIPWESASGEFTITCSLLINYELDLIN